MHDTSSPARLSFHTSCPAMVRVVVGGHHYEEEICRCDDVTLKKQYHPGRCKSTGGCSVQNELSRIEREQRIKMLSSIWGIGDVLLLTWEKPSHGTLPK